MKRKTVAVVDDHPFFRETACKYLTSLGFPVILEAANGMRLFQLLETSRPLPDICLLDVEMPVMDGYVTARLLRKRYPWIKIIALTLCRDEGKEARILDAGAHSILFKSMEPDEFKEGLLLNLES